MSTDRPHARDVEPHTERDHYAFSVDASLAQETPIGTALHRQVTPSVELGGMSAPHPASIRRT